jgi:thymidylate synthase ThyX
MINRISATIIADSVNDRSQRLTTFVLVFPRIVLAEFNTHRMISKNSASSRAIPFKTMVQKVQDEPFIPIGFQKEHKGMQGTNYFENVELAKTEELWLEARDRALTQASLLSLHGVTKQLCNRLLEPFLYHTVICTGTEWENFFALRAHPAAEIHIADLAFKMLKVYNESEPKQLKAKEWHIPFGDTFDDDRIKEFFTQEQSDFIASIVEGKSFTEKAKEVRFKSLAEPIKVKIATARCARVSYLNFEGKDDYEADIKLHDMLKLSGHYSPFEHCAQVMQTGFTQYRKMLLGENKTDFRVLLK